MKKRLEPIEQLRSCLTRQLEAHLRRDYDEYNRLEQELLEIEKHI